MLLFCKLLSGLMNILLGTCRVHTVRKCGTAIWLLHGLTTLCNIALDPSGRNSKVLQALGISADSGSFIALSVYFCCL